MTDDTQQFKAMAATAAASRQHTLDQAIATATAKGKEPFSMSNFEAALIDLNLTLERELSPEAWAEKYYVTYPDIMSLAEFARVMHEVDPFV
jgi:hypothetical protein